MSRVYFHSPSGDAELRGSERAWLRSVAEGPAQAAWELDTTGAYERAVEIMGWIGEKPDSGYGSNYLHKHLREAQARPRDYEARQRFVSSLKLALRVNGIELHVAGARLGSSNVDLNTALVAGSDPVRLAAKISGWCECHAYIEGPDRKWAADIIDQGLKTGIYRRTLRYTSLGDVPREASQGWEGVQELLRARDDEPVVLSYSVTESFPNEEIAGFERPRDEHGEPINHAWYELPAEERWDRAMTGLRQSQPWARLAPDTLAEVYFHLPVTVYDLFAPDRDARVRAAAELESVEVSAVPEEER